MKNHLSLFLSLLFTTTAAFAQTAQRPAANYQFESSARAVLAEAGATASKHPHLYLRTSNLYVLAVTNNHQLTLSTSSDGGDSFEPPVLISEAAAQVSSHGENSPTLAINGIEFYALWEQTNESSASELVFARSLRFGRKFDKPIKVTDKERPSQNGFSYLAVAPNGDLYAVWLDGRDPKSTAAGTSHVYFARSTDKGATWSQNAPIANNACPCCRPTLAFGADGAVYAVWRNVDNGDMRDMLLAVARDHGATWSAPRLLAQDNWKISGCPHSGASLMVKGQRLYAAWHSEGDSTNAGIRLTWSDDGGQTFAKPVIASANIVDTNHPQLALAEDGRLLLIFKGRDPIAKESWGALSAYLVEINANGQPSAPQLVPGNRKSISYPVVAAGTVGRAFIAWTEGGENGTHIRLMRARHANGGKSSRDLTTNK